MAHARGGGPPTVRATGRAHDRTGADELVGTRRRRRPPCGRRRRGPGDGLAGGLSSAAEAGVGQHAGSLAALREPGPLDLAGAGLEHDDRASTAPGGDRLPAERLHDVAVHLRADAQVVEDRATRPVDQVGADRALAGRPDPADGLAERLLAQDLGLLADLTVSLSVVASADSRATLVWSAHATVADAERQRRRTHEHAVVRCRPDVVPVERAEDDRGCALAGGGDGGQLVGLLVDGVVGLGRRARRAGGARELGLRGRVPRHGRRGRGRTGRRAAGSAGVRERAGAGREHHLEAGGRRGVGGGDRCTPRPPRARRTGWHRAGSPGLVTPIVPTTSKPDRAGGPRAVTPTA